MGRFDWRRCGVTRIEAVDEVPKVMWTFIKVDLVSRRKSVGFDSN